MSRPRFSAAWVAAMRIYAPINSAEKVALTIGGNVATNIQRWDKAEVSNPAFAGRQHPGR